MGTLHVSDVINLLQYESRKTFTRTARDILLCPIAYRMRQEGFEVVRAHYLKSTKKFKIFKFSYFPD